MRHLWPAALLLALLSHRVAQAEAQPLTKWYGGAFTVFINNPNVHQDGWRIDCPAENPNCFRLNRDACDPNKLSLPISFTLARGSGSSGASVDATTTRTVYAFLSKASTCLYSDISGQTGYNPNYLIGKTSSLPQGSVFYNNGTRPFTFPRDLDPASFNDNITEARTTGKFTTREMLTALGLCSNAGGLDTNLSTFFLCVGIDSSNKSGVNTGSGTTTTSDSTTSTSTSSSSDPTGYIQVQADTAPPAQPQSLLVRPRNGRVEAELTYDTSALDVYEILVRYTRDAQDVAAATTPDATGALRGCDAWQGNVQLATLNVRNQQDGNRTLDLAGLDNDVDWAFCAQSRDYLGNFGTPTPVVVARPRFECDLFACYPGTLQTGYCAAGAQPQLWAGASLGLLAWRLGSLRRGGRRRRWRLGGLLLVVAAAGLAHLPGQAWADPDAGNRPRSEAPVGQTTSRPQGVDAGDDDGEAATGKLRHPHLEFGDPMAQALNYGPAVARAPRFNAELRFTPYRPRVGDAAVQDVYGLMYTRKRRGIVPGHPLLYSLAFEYFATHRLGLFGPYVRVGYWQATGPTRLCSDAAGAQVRCTAATVGQSTAGNDTAWLGFVPITAGAIWRLDPLLAQLRLPVGVAVNAGLDYVLWWANSGGQRARYGAHRAQGATLGLHAGAQLSLQLDALFRHEARGASGVAGSHLFAEYQYSYGAALLGRARRAHLDTTDKVMVTVGLGMRFY